MRKLALFLALMTAPLCADNYMTVGVGPYVMIPNAGIGYTETVDIGELDLNANISFSRAVKFLELKSALRIPVGDVYLGPSIHVNYSWRDLRYGELNSGCGVVLGKKFESTFVEISLQDDILSTKGFKDLPCVKVRYGVSF